MPETRELQNLAINTLRFLSADAVQQANSGHPGLPMGAAPLAYTIWTRHLRHNPANPNWPDRDRISRPEHEIINRYVYAKHITYTLRYPFLASTDSIASLTLSFPMPTKSMSLIYSPEVAKPFNPIRCIGIG